MNISRFGLRYGFAAVALGAIATQLPALDNTALADAVCNANGCNTYRLAPTIRCPAPSVNTYTIQLQKTQMFMSCTNAGSRATTYSVTGPLRLYNRDSASTTVQCTGLGTGVLKGVRNSNAHCVATVNIVCVSRRNP